MLPTVPLSGIPHTESQLPRIAPSPSIKICKQGLILGKHLRILLHQNREDGENRVGRVGEKQKPSREDQELSRRV